MFTHLLTEYGQLYYGLSALVALACCLLTPSSLKPSTNFFGSLMTALMLGWLLWPVALYCVFHSRDLPFKAVNRKL